VSGINKLRRTVVLLYVFLPLRKRGDFLNLDLFGFRCQAKGILLRVIIIHHFILDKKKLNSLLRAFDSNLKPLSKGLVYEKLIMHKAARSFPQRPISNSPFFHKAGYDMIIQLQDEWSILIGRNIVRLAIYNIGLDEILSGILGDFR